MAYSVVNLVTFGIFVHASASMFFLLKASSPVVTALMLRFVFTRDITTVQWIAISAQCVGLLVTQFNPCTKQTAVSGLGYFLTADPYSRGMSCLECGTSTSSKTLGTV